VVHRFIFAGLSRAGNSGAESELKFCENLLFVPRSARLDLDRDWFEPQASLSGTPAGLSTAGCPQRSGGTQNRVAFADFGEEEKLMLSAFRHPRKGDKSKVMLSPRLVKGQSNHPQSGEVAHENAVLFHDKQQYVTK
jgi:hypothetical protein